MLETMPPLSSLTAARDPAAAACAYGERQGRGLAGLGVTLNFGPVVDLRPREKSAPGGLSNITARAIASDPRRVAEIAGAYLDGLNAAGVRGTLKHFPGLGRVARDTHVVTGEISATTAQLELSDWLPFRRLMGKPGIATMIGHVRVTAADKDTPASYSGEVINSFIRARTEGDVLLITDDLGMGAVTRSKDGLGGAAVKSVNAGVDLLLLSDAALYYDTVMSALIEADSNNEIDQARQIQARERLSKYVFVDDSPPHAAAPQHAQQEPPHTPPAN